MLTIRSTAVAIYGTVDGLLPASNAAGITLYGDYLYRNLYVMPIF